MSTPFKLHTQFGRFLLQRVSIKANVRKTWWHHRGYLNYNYTEPLFPKVTEIFLCKIRGMPLYRRIIATYRLHNTEQTQALWYCCLPLALLKTKLDFQWSHFQLKSVSDKHIKANVASVRHFKARGTHRRWKFRTSDTASHQCSLVLPTHVPLFYEHCQNPRIPRLQTLLFTTGSRVVSSCQTDWDSLLLADHAVRLMMLHSFLLLAKAWVVNWDLGWTSVHFRYVVH